jgi:hypothetical protein
MTQSRPRHPAARGSRTRAWSASRAPRHRRASQIYDGVVAAYIHDISPHRSAAVSGLPRPTRRRVRDV